MYGLTFLKPFNHCKQVLTNEPMISRKHSLYRDASNLAKKQTNKLRNNQTIVLRYNLLNNYDKL